MVQQQLGAAPAVDVEDVVSNALVRYDRQYLRFKALAEEVYEICRELLRKNPTIQARAERRVKTRDSFDRKVRQRIDDLEYQYQTGDEAFDGNALGDGIADIAGVRIVTYVESDRDRVIALIKEKFLGADGDSPPIEVNKDSFVPGNYYKAIHCRVSLDGITEESKPELQNLKGQICEIQVSSILAHCWNEIEHDLVYKPKQGEIPDEEKELLKVLGTLSTFGDTVIQQLKQSVNQRIKAHTGEFENLLDFIVRLKDKFPLATHFEKDPSQLYDELMRLGLDSPEKLALEELLTPPTTADLTGFNAFLEQQGLDYKLDPLTSDVLLFNLLKERAADVVQHHLGPGKVGRPLRIVSLAKSYQQSQEPPHPSAVAQEDSAAPEDSGQEGIND